MKIAYFPHDCNASGDYRIAALEAECGIAGYAVFFKAIEILHSTPKGEMEFETFILAVQAMVRDASVDVRAIAQRSLDLGLFVKKKRSKKFVLTSERVQKNFSEIWAKSEKARASALRGAELRRNLTSDRSADAQPTHSERSAIKLKSKSKLKSKLKLNISKSEAASQPQVEVIKPSLIQYGKNCFRTTEENHEKLIEKFSRPLLDQELEFMDEWLLLADTPSARKYRKPDHDHYLFACNWLKTKKLKYTNGAAQHAEPGESKFMQSFRRVTAELELEESQGSEKQQSIFTKDKLC